MALKEAEDFIGTVLAERYKLVELLGVGGMGAVYRAQHLHLESVRAVKLLLPEHANNENLVKRFHREARGLSRLHHPNVVKVVDTGQSEEGLPFIAMEFLEGEPLTATLERHGRLPWPTVKVIARQVCQALHAAHEAGIIHRDIKPENCFRVAGQEDPYTIKLLDFGIARIHKGTAVTKLTQTGSVMGTLHYMSYEQVAGEVCDRRSDIWSVAVMLYELLSGTLPFMGENMGKIFFAIVQYEPIPVSQAAPSARLPPQLDAVLARALEKDTESRYATMIEFLDALEAIPGTAGGIGSTEGIGSTPGAQTAVEVPLDNRQTEMYRRPLHAKVETSTSEAVAPVDRVTGERVLSVKEPAKVVTDTHASFPATRPQGKRSGLVMLFWILGALVLGIVGWNLLGGEDAKPVAEEVVGTTSNLTSEIESTTIGLTTIGVDTVPAEDLPGTTGETEDVEEKTEEIPPKKKTSKSKKVRKKSTAKKSVPKKSVPKEPAPSLKERTKKDAQKLTGLLKTLCSSSLSPGDSPKVVVRIHRTGGVDFVGWDAKSKFLFQGTSLERCVKRVVKGFTVVPGDDSEKSVKRVVGFRK